MEDFNNKSYEKRIEDIKNNLYIGGGAAQAGSILNIMMSSFSNKEFTGASDISVDLVLSIISGEIHSLKRIVRDGGIVPIKMFENCFKGMIRPHDSYACLDKDLKFCVRQYGTENWKDILYVFPYMNCSTAFDVTFKYDNIHCSDMSGI